MLSVYVLEQNTTFEFDVFHHLSNKKYQRIYRKYLFIIINLQKNIHSVTQSIPLKDCIFEDSEIYVEKAVRA